MPGANSMLAAAAGLITNSGEVVAVTSARVEVPSI